MIDVVKVAFNMEIAKIAKPTRGYTGNPKSYYAQA